MTDNIIIREIEDSDYEILAEFNSNFSDDGRTKSEWLERYKMWWDDNPAYIKGHPRGVVAFNNNTVIGTTNNFPTRMIWDNKEITVINGSTWRVNQDFRKISMDIWHKHREITKGFILFNTTASSNVVRLLKHLRFTEYCVCNFWFYYFGNPAVYNKSSFQIRVASFFQKILKSFMIKKKTKINIKEKVNSYKEIDELWQNHKNDYSFTNIRDALYVNWLSKRTLMLYLYCEDKLIGYFCFKKNTSLNTVMLVDFWPYSVSSKVFQIIEYLIKNFPNYNIIIPSYNHRFYKAAKRNYLIKRSKCSKGYIYFGNENPIQIDKSFLTLLQGDFAI